MSSSPRPNEWLATEHALQYLARTHDVPHRSEGEAALRDFGPKEVGRILNLGTADRRLLAHLRSVRPSAEGGALDVSPAMLRAARERFGDDGMGQILQRDLEEPLPDLGQFDAIVWSFAIHHVTDMRKEALWTTAVHSLEAEVELNIIVGWLGHASLDTTHRYAEIGTRTKIAALETRLHPVANGDGQTAVHGRYKTPELLDYLDSL